jgi:hypothetical protein
MALALKVLNAHYGIGGKVINPADVEKLKTYLGEAAKGLPADQIACAVIELELKKLKRSRGASA